MATSELEKQAQRSLQSKNAELTAMVNEATSAAAEAIRDRDKAIADQNARLEMYKRTIATMGNARTVGVDIGGGVTAVLSSEMMNWGIRALGDWSKTGWLARNNDLLQSLPQLGIGILVYIAEMVGRPPIEKKLPTKTRQVLREASKVFAAAGLINLARAVRFRLSHNRSMVEENAAMKAELEALRAAQKAA